MVLGQYRAVWVEIWCLLGQREAELLDTGSVEGSSGQYLVVLGQYGAVLVGTWWYWVSIT